MDYTTGSTHDHSAFADIDSVLVNMSGLQSHGAQQPADSLDGLLPPHSPAYTNQTNAYLNAYAQPLYSSAVGHGLGYNARSSVTGATLMVDPAPSSDHARNTTNAAVAARALRMQEVGLDTLFHM